MKKFAIFFVFILLFSGIMQSQELRINSYAAYTFDDKINLYDFRGNLNGGLFYGAGLEYIIPANFITNRFGLTNINSNFGLELKYQRINSLFEYPYSGSVLSTSYNSNYIMAGFNHYIPFKVFEPFYGLDLGVSVLNIKKSDPLVKFAWGVKLGTNIALTPTVSLRFQADLKSIVESIDPHLNIGWGGVNPSISTYSTIYQISLGGGLIFKIATN